jgi:hypothetical protein
LYDDLDEIADEKLNAQRCMLVPEEQNSSMPDVEMKYCPKSITLENRNIAVAPSPPEKWYEMARDVF